MLESAARGSPRRVPPHNGATFHPEEGRLLTALHGAFAAHGQGPVIARERFARVAIMAQFSLRTSEAR